MKTPKVGDWLYKGNSKVNILGIDHASGAIWVKYWEDDGEVYLKAYSLNMLIEEGWSFKKPKPVELTLEEVSQRLGYEVKIVEKK